MNALDESVGLKLKIHSAVFSVVAAVHSRFVFGRRVRVLSNQVASLLPPGRVLDVGCGDCSITFRVGELRPDASLLGTDILVRPKHPVRVLEFDGETLPVDTDAMSAVMLVDVLHHTRDSAHILRECKRVAPCIVVKDHIAGNAVDRMILRVMDWFGNRAHGVVLAYNYFDRDSWQATLTAAGLVEDVHVPVPGLYPFPFSYIFGRRLHFVARLRPKEITPAA
jgi:SAM-dependent methyltransferase